MEIWDADDFDPWNTLRWETVRVIRYRQYKPDGSVNEVYWLTDFPRSWVGSRTIFRMAKSRWEIENQRFNDAKNSYGFEHICYHERHSLLAVWLLTWLALTIERLYRMRLPPSRNPPGAHFHRSAPAFATEPGKAGARRHRLQLGTPFSATPCSSVFNTPPGHVNPCRCVGCPRKIGLENRKRLAAPTRHKANVLPSRNPAAPSCEDSETAVPCSPCKERMELIRSAC